MADPLSITASVVGIVAVGIRITKLAAFIISEGKAAPAELIELDAELSLLKQILLRIEAHHPKRDEDDESTVSDIERNTAYLQTVLKETEKKISAIDKLFHGTAIAKVKFSLTWSSARRDLKELQARLERCKTSLLLTLQLLSLDGINSLAQSNTTRPLQALGASPSQPSASAAQESDEELEPGPTVDDDDTEGQLLLWEKLAAEDARQNAELRERAAAMHGSEIDVAKSSNVASWFANFSSPSSN
ncbi:hypothetical protein B0H63DRAFT_231600 [Podospora didyma]|uniref:Fungal N-terminal domain-containing protein n=1 Tax=Podospora didyma TaxID=330526 RepID=A0AAE0KKJ6_9PEZI|nr:hypothetical protein B0H63DRAFT_231600 [Podospora didyma]